MIFSGNPEPPCQFALLSKQTLALEKNKATTKVTTTLGWWQNERILRWMILDWYRHRCTIAYFLTMWQPRGPSHVSSCSPSQKRASDNADFRLFALRLFCVELGTFELEEQQRFRFYSQLKIVKKHLIKTNSVVDVLLSASLRVQIGTNYEYPL